MTEIGAVVVNGAIAIAALAFAGIEARRGQWREAAWHVGNVATFGAIGWLWARGSATPLGVTMLCVQPLLVAFGAFASEPGVPQEGRRNRSLYFTFLASLFGCLAVSWLLPGRSLRTRLGFPDGPFERAVESLSAPLIVWAVAILVSVVAMIRHRPQRLF